MGELHEDPALRDARRPFADRSEGGRALARAMGRYRSSNATVLALPPGGVPVGLVVAKSLSLPLGLFFSEALDHPGTGEMVGGIAWNGRTVWDRRALGRSPLSPWEQRRVRRDKLEGMRHRARRFGVRPTRLEGGVVLVDDGASAWPVLLAAVRDLRSRGAEEVVLAFPAASRSTVLMLINEVDDLYCPSVHKEDVMDGRGVWGRATVSDAEAYALWVDDQQRGEY